MVGLCEGGNEPPGSLKASKTMDNWASDANILLKMVEGKEIRVAGDDTIKAMVLPQGSRSRAARIVRKMERKIVGVSLKDKVSNTALQKITASENITQKALITKWKWGGHVARQQQGRWARETTMWDPYIGRRTQGRPRRRWADTFKQQPGGNWSTIARNRNEWRQIVNKLI
ncbi:hypothetical protein ANN_07123 [Periplaneta americana]|uniref:Uncharacterized protein n=1 Tax=Periplaneta americana TaxID=6978 RepID=A0ABQ8TFC9_PERAM|nr:hypothetical protein ANN_07123 [Periplaneta americana]